MATAVSLDVQSSVELTDETGQDTHQHPRKRRRLSDPDSSEENPSVRPQSSSTTSRIKPRANGLPSASAVLAEIEISNGKVVDARSSFATIDVAPWLIASLANMAILRPTAIQKGCIPEILNGRDVIGGSRTGSGKTVAFAVPILQKWAEDPMGIFAIVLTPTR